MITSLSQRRKESMLMVLCPMIVGKCGSSGSVQCANNLICASNFIFFHLGWQRSQVLQGRGGSAVADLKGVPWNTPFHGLPLRILSMSSLQHNNLICTSDTYRTIGTKDSNLNTKCPAVSD